ncbi:hypothetical protein CDL12_25465 [Handroanthus impetiginosus]|uniref:Uncharacterized protein n=1 Tax=Handroanthus impetiginosus TaxID=429701 RepID=A0A2G9G9T2_9LAMI|nr:hypothetical protein CDL12_25465 [Handroanthus impetiginosus]
MAEAQPTVTKPSRSDDVLDAAQQLQIYNQVRAQFESLAPKRPVKPNRSEPDSISPTISTPDHEDLHLHELDKLRSLQSQSQAIFSETSIVEQDDFVETQYYTALDSIDKQHYTTGSGFIKVAPHQNIEQGYDLERENGGGNYREMVFKTNPATNDWIPKFDEYQVGYVSSKPNRSESS